MGTYSDKNNVSGNTVSKTLKVTIAPGSFSVNCEELNPPDDNTVSKMITLKRDFSVNSVSADKSAVFENESTLVTFTIKNNNPYKEYIEVPVTVYFKDALGNNTKIAETTCVMGKGAGKTCKITVNVGNVTANNDQNDIIYVMINYDYPSSTNGKRFHEVNPTNNFKTTSIKVKRDINLSIKLVDTNAAFSANATCVTDAAAENDTQAVTSCLVFNNSRFNLYGADAMNDTITVYFYIDNVEKSHQTTVIPANGSNLIFFKWTIPESESVTLSVKLVWNVDEENSPNPYADNSASFSKVIKPVSNYATTDTKLVKNYSGNKNYSTADGYTAKKPYVAKWSKWICSDTGAFTLIKYALSTESAVSLTPMASANYSDGNTIASGSAFSAIINYKIITECSSKDYSVTELDYTYAQNMVASFPEFRYVTDGECRTMYLTGNGKLLSSREFQFAINPASDENQRVHFTPVNMQDGQCKVGILGYDLWTPAGMIYVNGSGSLLIGDSVYNDNYVN